MRTIALSAALAGVLDISTTAIIMAKQGVSIRRLLQFISSGALGDSAFEGGNWTAAIGLSFHFLIASVVAAIYYKLSRRIPMTLDRPLLFGALYGVAVHLIMNRIVVPLSRAPKRQFSFQAFLTQLVIHVFCVGLPIAVMQNLLSR